jgi:hypothetical protein
MSDHLIRNVICKWNRILEIVCTCCATYIWPNGIGKFTFNGILTIKYSDYCENQHEIKIWIYLKNSSEVPLNIYKTLAENI